ncbi:MAG: hypothetical protein NTV84_00990 [Methanoregula sp.]|nr:hypothetical protein [Methanoregula sp.]
MRETLPDGVAEKLESYVYVYVDPETEKPFYIGKGTGDRFLAHLNVQPGTAKGDRINEIRDHDKEPRIDILRWGLSESEANLVEAAAIDLIGKENLVNLMSGHHPSHGRTKSMVRNTKLTSEQEITPLPEVNSVPKGSGRITSKDLIAMVAAKPVTVDDKVILITINQLYRSNMTPLALYEATRGIWRMGPRREEAEYAMAVYQGVVREVFRIDEWFPSGTLPYKTRDATWFKNCVPPRWEFSGEVAPQNIRDKYIDKSVGKGLQNPIRYVNV